MGWPHHRQQEPTPNAGPDHRVGRLLLGAPRRPGIDDTVLNAIITLWGDTPAAPLARNEPIDLAVDLELEAGLGSEGYDEAQCMAIAQSLIAWIKELLPHEFGEPHPQAASASAPSSPPPSEAPSEAAERAAEARLRNMATPRLTRSGMDARVSREVCLWIDVSGSDAHFKKVIVLNGGVISGMDAGGTICCPFGVTVEITGMDAKVKIKHMSRVDLLAMALEF